MQLLQCTDMYEQHEHHQQVPTGESEQVPQCSSGRGSPNKLQYYDNITCKCCIDEVGHFTEELQLHSRYRATVHELHCTYLQLTLAEIQQHDLQFTVSGIVHTNAHI
jgi:hypothetical protein